MQLMGIMQTIFYKHKSESSRVFLEQIFSTEKFSKCLIIHGKHSYESSGGKVLLAPLYESDSQIQEWSDFTSNPKRDEVEVGVKIKNVFNPDLVIAIGGGSIIDMAKLVRFYSNEKSTPLLAIPTTSGTGAESTKFAVCYENGVKTSVCDESILPNYVYLDSDLTLHNSEYLTACTGFDALAQAIEAYWNINATDESDELALKAIGLLLKNLVDFSKQDEEKRRAELMEGANLAGQAINITRTTAPHAMSYTLTSKFGYPHGHAVALTFPFFFELNVDCKQEDYQGQDYETYHCKMAKLREVLAITEDNNLFAFMKRYICKLGLAFDTARPIDEDVVAKGINLERAKNNPHILNEDIIKNVVQSIK